ncbi:MAG: VWA domain-containing protein [Bacteroidetes bacterium]|nr:VWA domain-containing protein [Bacteroidota bacterium]
MKGFRFEAFVPGEEKPLFDQLFDLLKELLIYTNGDVEEAIHWMNELDRQYQITNAEYGMGDFIRDLEERGFLKDRQDGVKEITSKMEQVIRKGALEELFGKIKKGNSGNHSTMQAGSGDENLSEFRPYRFGDSMDKIALTESLYNATVRSAGTSLSFSEEDLVMRETEYQTQTSTVLMIDISHSMILYGEDRITPAKKVAMALSEYITTRFPKDTLDIIVFGNDAWEVSIKDLPYLQVGPFHTNTVAGLQLAREILRRKKNPNKQILMITDGKPSCLKEPGGYYKNSFGLDRKIVNKTLNEAAGCRRQKINITTFMIASDSYLREFIAEFTEAANGKAFYSGLDKLGSFVLHDYLNNKKKNV